MERFLTGKEAWRSTRALFPILLLLGCQPETDPTLGATATAALSASPYLRMRFDEAAGSTTFSDSSASSYGYTSSCDDLPCPTAGGSGVTNSAIQFNGSSLVTLSAAAPQDLASGKSFSALLWVKLGPGAGQGTYEQVFEAVSPIAVLGGGFVEPNTFANIRSFSGPDGLKFYTEILLEWLDTSNITHIGSASFGSPVVSSDGWNHLALIVDDRAKTLSFYVNGVAVSGSPGTYSEQFWRTPGLDHYNFGGHQQEISPLHDGFHGSFHGSIDEVALYNLALPAGDVAAIYAQQSHPEDSPDAGQTAAVGTGGGDTLDGGPGPHPKPLGCSAAGDPVSSGSLLLLLALLGSIHSRWRLLSR